MPKDKQPKASGKTVALTVRVPRDVWRTAHIRAIEEGKSLQEIGLLAFRRYASPTARREGKVL